MSLFSSLYTGVSGMNAQSQHTATISTNIANMTTVGYKKTDTVFHDLVVNNTRPARFANGGVLTDRVLRADIQGSLQQTGSATEMGIVGAGFFTVKTQDSADAEFLYTRNGTFSPDVDGVMRNAAGFILYGWPVDPDGNVIAGNTLSSLEPVDVDQFDAEFRATTNGELGVNLNGAQAAINPFLTGGGVLPVSSQSTWDTILQTTVDTSQPAHFSRDMTVYDNTGTPRQMTFEYRKITGPMAQATSQTSGLDYTMSLTDPSFLANVNPGDSFTITAGVATQEYIIGAAAGPGQVRVDTVGELTNHVNSFFGGGTAVDVTIDTDGRLLFKAIDPTINLNFADTSGTPLTGAGTINLFDLTNSPLINNIAGNNPENPNQTDFPPFGNLANPNTNGWWEVRVLKEADPSLTSADGLFGQKVEISKGLINFDGSGQLNTPRDALGAVTDGVLTLNSGSFDAGIGGEDITVQIDMGRFNQYAGAYNVLIQNQNGAEAGTLTGVEITREGFVVASFTNGEQFEIFQVPLAHFINPNGLESVSGTVFAETQESGVVEILEAGTGGAGIIEAATVENSNVDLADEFANLIVSQRAFSANSRVVNTIDEMTQLLRQLKV